MVSAWAMGFVSALASVRAEKALGLELGSASEFVSASESARHEKALRLHLVSGSASASALATRVKV
jgi:hypothetical protein